MLYILGATAGSGMIAAPKATVGAGIIGLVSLPLIVLIAIFTAIALARCWLITTKVNSAYQGEVRYPLAAIAFMAFGHPGKVFTSAMMGVALFCYSVVNLLAASSTFEAMTKDWLPMPLCGWLIIVAAVVCPITWFRTPRESLPVAVTAFLVSLTAASIMFIVIVSDTSAPLHVEYPKVTFVSLCNAWSTYSYTVAGHPYFTTIQNAMKRQSAFKVSVALALLGKVCQTILLP
ncbi:uncharacterized protein [Antedon mediterranea]|uniref:uncharacterized protein n=1 Tax=Antedon mediterranea TaxID=105859 RepID=UPI003AF7F4A1